MSTPTDDSHHEVSNTTTTMYYLYVIGFAELLVFAQAASLINDRKGIVDTTYGHYCQYAIALGVIAALVVIAMGVLIRLDSMNPMVHKVMALFLFVWNAVGVGVTTFGDPFTNIGFTPNGYFGVWTSLFISAVLLGQILAPTNINHKSEAAREQVRETLDKFQETTLLVVLVVASIIMIIVAAIQCADTSCQKVAAFAVAFAVINSATSFTLIFLNKQNPILYAQLPLVVLIANAVWWVVGFLVITLTVNRFAFLGNGYLAAVFGTICAILLPSVKQKGGATEDHSV